MREDADTNTEYSDEANRLAGAGPCSGATSGRETTALTVERLKFEALRSALYHDMCETRLARLHRFLTFLTVLGGSGAVVALGAEGIEVSWIGSVTLGQVFGIAIAAIASIQLVWDFSGAARDHRELRRKFYALLARLERAEVFPDEVSSEMVLLYAEEPGLRKRINRLAHNQAGRSIYGDGSFRKERAFFIQAVANAVEGARLKRASVSKPKAT
ncbi:MAG: hypothetical protein EpisKO_15810 [Epibacterium sp.]